MSRMKTLCAALFAVFALTAAVSATQAAAELPALPDVHTLSDVGYPVTGEGTLENGGAIVAELETILGEKLTATAVNVKATLEKLSALGPGTLTFTGVQEPRTKTSCLTAKAAEGEVKFSGEYHIVTNAALSEADVLILFTELTVECNKGKLKIKVKAPALIKISGLTSGTDVSSYKLAANCTAKGKQELTEYINDGGTTTKEVLLANFGLGLETSCERASKELTVTSSAMIDFLF